MANSENLPIADMNLDDVDAGLLLSGEANWNQVGDDWRLFIRHGKTIGFRDTYGRLIASAAALPYESAFGFIAMVLVTKRWRRRGLATRLVDYCIGWLHKQRRIPVLDATLNGAKVYRHQGFRPLFELDRWQIETPLPLAVNEAHTGEISEPLGAQEDVQHLVRLDAEAVGARRAFLLVDFFARNDTRTFVSEGGRGFAMIRRGRRASQIGPIVAQSQDDAIKLLSRALSSAGGAVFVDVPTMSAQVGLWLKNHGFSKQRSFLRMALGQMHPFGATEKMFSSAGPEFG